MSRKGAGSRWHQAVAAGSPDGLRWDCPLTSLPPAPIPSGLDIGPAVPGSLSPRAAVAAVTAPSAAREFYPAQPPLRGGAGTALNYRRLSVSEPHLTLHTAFI